MSKKFCPECFCALAKNEDCSECGYETPKKKKTISDKRKNDSFEVDKNQEWTSVPSHYKDYRKK